MPLDIPRIQALCFDLDGTLNDTDDQFEQSIERLLLPFRFFFPNKNPRPFARKIVMFSETPGNFLIGIPDKLHIDKPLALIGDYFYRKGHRNQGGFLMIPGVLDLLTEMRTRFPLAIVSARGSRNTQAFLEQFNLSTLFQCVATAQTCRFTKPYPDPIIWAARQMNVEPEACLMIGDTPVDIQAARAAGAQSVGVLCGFGSERELRLAGADLIIENTARLSVYLTPKSPKNANPNS